MFKIKRFDGKVSSYEEYPLDKNKTLLENINNIKEKIDESICYKEGCRNGLCGSCAVIVNDKEVLACKTKIKNDDIIKPLRNSKVIKDLVVDSSYEEKLLQNANAYLEEYSNETINSEDEKLIDIQSNCILCQSCFSSCPVYEVNDEFLGPYALTRSFRYIQDKKEKNKKTKLASIQNNGIWDCTLCGNCTIVCPQGIDPKNDILMLRMKSIQNGYEDKNLNQNSFNMDFGFNPNRF